MSCLTDVCPQKVSVEDKIVSVAVNYFCETFQSGQTQRSRWVWINFGSFLPQTFVGTLISHCIGCVFCIGIPLLMPLIFMASLTFWTGE